MKPRLKEEPLEWQKFTLSAVVAFAAISSVLAWRSILPAWLTAVLAIALAAVLTAALVRPAWFRRPYRMGMAASAFVGERVGRLILALVFLGVLTPLGWLLRLTGKDLLRLKRDPKAASYWQSASTTNDLESMF